jgi:hypothetical protein
MNRATRNWNSLSEFLSDPVVQLAIGLLVLVIVSLIGLYGLSRLRSINAHNLQIDDVVRRNFEEMRTEGDLDDQEFRKIEALLAKNTSRERRPTPTNLPSSNT